jgi:FMN phosphatase YigB (HAD superfamily)
VYVKYSALVFDLDDTLLDTTNLLIPIWGTPEFKKRLESPLPLMEGAMDNLLYLQKKYPLYLLTFGDIEIQKMKIQSMNIKSFFAKIFLANSETKESKATYFNQMTQPFLSIGNRRSTDIRLAKQSGGKTCLLKYGEHKNEPIELPEDIPDFEIRKHSELIPTCQL